MNDSGLSYPSIAGLAILAIPAWTAALVADFLLPLRILLLVFGVLLSALAFNFVHIAELDRRGKTVFLVSTFLSLLVFNLLEERVWDVGRDVLFGGCVLIPLICIEIYLKTANKP